MNKKILVTVTGLCLVLIVCVSVGWYFINKDNRTVKEYLLGKTPHSYQCTFGENFVLYKEYVLKNDEKVFSGLYRCNLNDNKNSSTKTQLLSDSFFSCANIYRDKVIFINDECKIEQVDMENNNSEILYDNNGKTIMDALIIDDCLYFIAECDEDVCNLLALNLTNNIQKQIIEDAKKGLVDVLIGTHRIISKDINMPNLGLVVIDEEQRFGVKHKESLKKIKSTVDVLTLSATPIPRTLHMSLSGIRDMSVIEEPPQERHPVITYVTEAKESIIQDEIERELGRGGQVFFVYNRVERIEEMASMIQRLVPDAKVAVAHGRMTSKDLENIILGFLNKEFNVLVCTTIIETGMDISNANTMIVYDADKMGLAQLYQLRGRVGRSTRQGYAYLMYEKDKVLSEIAEKRLKAIREFTEFGSGFKIAMRDLEIRGAGNILGSQQHGHMAVIGYDLYVKMLNDAIKKVKGEVVSEDIDVEIDLSVNAYIPDNYITDELIKIEMYKKIASIESKEDMYDVQEELEDRFSDIPKSVETLLKIAYIKTLCKTLKIEKVRQIKDEILLNPLTRYKTKEKIGYNIVNELEELLENMCNLKLN